VIVGMQALARQKAEDKGVWGRVGVGKGGPGAARGVDNPFKAAFQGELLCSEKLFLLHGSEELVERGGKEGKVQIILSVRSLGQRGRRPIRHKKCGVMPKEGRARRGLAHSQLLFFFSINRSEERPTRKTINTTRGKGRSERGG